MANRDLNRLKHMLESTEAILTFTKGRKRGALDQDRLLTSAVLREFEIIGEAAGRITPKTKREFPSLPWKELVGMRNRLIHAYFNVDHDIVWKTIREYLPSFRKNLSEIIVSLENLH